MVMSSLGLASDDGCAGTDRAAGPMPALPEGLCHLQTLRPGPRLLQSAVLCRGPGEAASSEQS